MSSGAEMRDALEDAIRRAYTESLGTDWDGSSIVGTADTTHLRRVTAIQKAAWDAVRVRLAPAEEPMHIEYRSSAGEPPVGPEYSNPYPPGL